MKKDIGTVEELMRVLETENLTEIDYECGEFKLNLKRPYKAVKKVETKAKTAVVATKVENISYLEIVSQDIGRFYSAQKGGESKLVVGATVKEGEEIGHILTMGVKNPVVSNVTGVIHEICVADGDIADFNKVILKLKK